MKISYKTLLYMESVNTKILYDCTGRWARYQRLRKPKKRLLGIDKAVDLVVIGLVKRERNKDAEEM